MPPAHPRGAVLVDPCMSRNRPGTIADATASAANALRGPQRQVCIVQRIAAMAYARPMRLGVVWWFALVLALPAPLRADDAPVPAAVESWAVGVSDEEQAAALALYEQGNVEFQAARFAQALAKYSEALRHWNHPAIHFNMAICLINLDQPLDAIDHLEKALQYGARALGPDLYAQGLTYKHSLDGQIARVRIACKEPGAVVTLDGATLFTSPGEAERLVMPGRHQVVATKPGFLTASETLDLVPARLTKYDVHLIAFKSNAKLVRRWQPWAPYAVIAGGAVVGGIGALFYRAASNSFAHYDAGIMNSCPHGCDADMAAALTELDARRHRGDVEQGVALSLFAVGGAAVLTGLVGVILNQPHAPVEIAPAAGGGATASMRWAF